MNRRAKLILFQQRPCVFSAQFNTTRVSNLKEIGKFADGAIIGSALINKIRETKDDNIVDVAGKFISSLI